MITFSDSMAAFRWWGILLIFGILAFPLAYRLLHRLPDRGYAFVKMIGLLIVSYAFWLLNSLGFLANTMGGILFAILVLILFSVWALRMEFKSVDVTTGESGDQGPFKWLVANWRYVVTIELLFAGFFALWVWVRAQNPVIGGTEKPMELAFLNAVSRSSTFPPIDPWLSGYGISYYYFGYVMTSVLGRLAAVPEQIGFNLAIAWLVAGSAIGAFGVVYNFIAAQDRWLRRRATFFAIVAAFAITLASNNEMLLEIMHANEIGSDSFWTWLDIRDLNQPPAESEQARYETGQWWWWRSSRVIHEYHLSGRTEEGLEPIAENPSFSYVLGDLHPHVLALPFAFLSLAVAFSWWLNPKPAKFRLHWFFGKQGYRSSMDDSDLDNRGLFLFSALLLGGLSFLNTWDVLIHLFIFVGAYSLARWRREQVFRRDLVIEAFFLTAVFVVLAVILYLPFYLGFRSQAGAPFLLPMSMQPTRLAHVFAIFGLPLTSIVVLVGALVFWAIRQPRNIHPRRPWLMVTGIVAGLIVALFLLMILLGWIIAVSPEGEGRIVNLALELDLELSSPPGSQEIGARLGWATRAVGLLIPVFLSARISQPAAILFLAILLACILYLLIRFLNESTHSEVKPRQIEVGQSLPFVLLLVGVGALLVLVPEFVYLRDNFGQRLNTIFKFYYQAWVFFGVSAVFSLEYLLRRFKIAGFVTSAAYAVLLVFALLYPYYAVRSRSIEYRGQPSSETRLPATLDGLAYLKRYDWPEYDAIQWLRQNVDGTQVILEATGGQYSSYGRVAAATGLPTVLGWAGHEYQWRGYTNEPGERDPAIDTIYSYGSWDESAALLDKYNVSLIYYGTLERNDYGARLPEKFENNLEVAYENQGVTIFKWNPDS